MTVRNTFATEIEAHVLQLKEEGWCVIEGVIPENEVGAVREEAENLFGHSELSVTRQR